jgi:GT2 family glycosyltransferase
MIPVMIVPTLNRGDLLQSMLDSIDYPIQHLLILDNGNQGREWFVPNMVRNVHLVDLPSNLGVAGAWNLGIKLFPHADRWLFASDDVVFEPGGLERLFEDSSADHVVLSSAWPHWETFVVGENVVRRIGLFDEAIYPANFEDDDYLRRCGYYGIDVQYSDFAHSHVQQGTVFSPEFDDKNRATYPNNEVYFAGKIERSDFTEGGWKLDRRRENDWGV